MGRARVGGQGLCVWAMGLDSGLRRKAWNLGRREMLFSAKPCAGQRWRFHARGRGSEWGQQQWAESVLEGCRPAGASWEGVVWLQAGRFGRTFSFPKVPVTAPWSAEPLEPPSPTAMPGDPRDSLSQAPMAGCSHKEAGRGWAARLGWSLACPQGSLGVTTAVLTPRVPRWSGPVLAGVGGPGVPAPAVCTAVNIRGLWARKVGVDPATRQHFGEFFLSSN